MLTRFFHDLWRQWLRKSLCNVLTEPARIGADLPQRLDHSFPRYQPIPSRPIVAEPRRSPQRIFPSARWALTLWTNVWEREHMAKIRHLAIKTKSPERLAVFYEEVFGLKRIRSEKGGAIYMSDGYLTVALLRNRGEATPSGINHFGFHVDDVKDIEQKLKRFDEPLEQRPGNRPYAEYRAMDPDGNLFDVSAHGYEEAEFKADRDARAVSAQKDKVPS